MYVRKLKATFRSLNHFLQELKVLEENFEQTILREEAALTEAAAGASGGDVEALKLSLKEATNKYEVCMKPFSLNDQVLTQLPTART